MHAAILKGLEKTSQIKHVNICTQRNIIYSTFNIVMITYLIVHSNLESFAKKRSENNNRNNNALPHILRLDRVTYKIQFQQFHQITSIKT